MEFSEIREKFEGLNADQVCELAKFGKEILDHAGMFGLSSGLLNLIKDILNADDYVYDDNKCTIETLIHIIGLVNDLTEKCLLHGQLSDVALRDDRGGEQKRKMLNKPLRFRSAVSGKNLSCMRISKTSGGNIQETAKTNYCYGGKL